MELKDVVANNIRLMRQKKEMTQDDLAKKTGLAVNYLSRIENARMEISLRNLSRIAKALNVMPADLLIEKTGLTQISDSEVSMVDVKSVESTILLLEDYVKKMKRK